MNQRYEREIDDLLAHMDRRRRRDSLLQRLKRAVGSLVGRLAAISRPVLGRPPAERLLIIGLIAVVLATVTRLFGLGQIASVLGLLSLVCFIAGIGLSVTRRGRGARYAPRWRGQDLGPLHRQRIIWDDLRAWLRRRRR